MSTEMETVEVLEAAIEAVAAKYGCMEISIDYTMRPNCPAHAVTVTYPDGKAATATGRTLREALSAASVEAINSAKP